MKTKRKDDPSTSVRAPDEKSDAVFGRFGKAPIVQSVVAALLLSLDLFRGHEVRELSQTSPLKSANVATEQHFANDQLRSTAFSQLTTPAV